MSELVVEWVRWRMGGLGERGGAGKSSTRRGECRERSRHALTCSKSMPPKRWLPSGHGSHQRHCAAEVPRHERPHAEGAAARPAELAWLGAGRVVESKPPPACVPVNEPAGGGRRSSSSRRGGLGGSLQQRAELRSYERARLGVTETTENQTRTRLNREREGTTAYFLLIPLD